MEFIDFFAGIGGFHSGLTQAGMTCKGWVEFDEHARRSYEAMYNVEGVWTARDVRKIGGGNVPHADLWAFGFPCQDISVAGKQRGMAKGTRSGLFFEIMRLIDEKEGDKPKWLLVENVKNLLAIDRGITFFTVLNEMVKRGYGVEWGLYNSKNYGVPQNRERVYIVGYHGNTGGRKILPRPRESENAIKQVGNMMETENFGGNPQTGRVYSAEGCAPTLSTPGGGGHIPKIIVSGHLPRRGQRGVIYDSNGIVGALTATDYKGPKLISVQAVVTPKRMERNMYGRRVKNDGEPSFTLTTQDRHGVILKDSEGGVRIRTLTPKECWRLQGFTDEQFEKAAKVNSNTQLYKQAGNAVTVPVVKEIGQAIMEFESKVKDEK